jgi:ribosomal peptide maturation radical SAM protein 1
VRVLLVSAPFGLIEYPHLGLGLIKAAVRRAGFPCDVWYPSLEFAHLIGFHHYRPVESAASYLLLPERLFASALAPRVPPLDAYVDACLEHFEPTGQVFFGNLAVRVNRASLARVEEAARRYVDGLAARPELGAYDVVGFSSSFGQQVASLAIAKRLKELHPHLTICFGGANCDGPMGRQLVQSFPFVDWAFAGDGDVTFPLFLERLAAGRRPDLPGVFDAAGARAGGDAYVPLTRAQLDELPYPDFDDFFAACDRIPEGRSQVRAIPVESSRGCWWGEKHHCTFCGLNGMTMAYRSKSPQRFADEIQHLVSRYGVRRVMATDNILDMRYLRSLVPLLRERRVHEALFYEVKSNLGRADLEALLSAGISEVQPGVESLSTHVLQLIDKGCTALQNVQLLKWGEELGMTLVWPILCGVPGETAEDYAAMLALMRKIPHLQPARGINRLSVDRFSPYFRTPERWGMTIYPAPAYRYVYDLPEADIERLAFWWCYDHAGGSTRHSMEAPPYAQAVARQRTIWAAQYGSVALRYRVADDGTVEIEDTRPSATEEHIRLDALASAVFLAADRIVTAMHVRRELVARGLAVDEGRVLAVLEALEGRGLVHREGDRWLALATRVADAAPEGSAGVTHGYSWRHLGYQR